MVSNPASASFDPHLNLPQNEKNRGCSQRQEGLTPLSLICSRDGVSLHYIAQSFCPSAPKMLEGIIRLLPLASARLHVRVGKVRKLSNTNYCWKRNRNAGAAAEPCARINMENMEVISLARGVA